MAFANSVSTCDVYSAAWNGAVGANFDIRASLGQPCRAIYVGHGGSLVVTRPDGTSVTIPYVWEGSVLPIQAVALTAAGSTAHSILLLA